jgi:hypothetical protein
MEFPDIISAHIDSTSLVVVRIGNVRLAFWKGRAVALEAPGIPCIASGGGPSPRLATALRRVDFMPSQAITGGYPFNLLVKRVIGNAFHLDKEQTKLFNKTQLDWVRSEKDCSYWEIKQ